MTKDEALDLALEALENGKRVRNAEGGTKYQPDLENKAITAIKQARALDKKAENARELGLGYEPDYKVTVVDDQHPKGIPLEQWGRPAPVQEPVKFLANGTRFKTSEFPYGVCINGLPKELSGRWVALVAAEDNCHLKLTTPPAAKRQWVGLTPEDYKDIFKAQTCERVVQLAEAILKEKNT